MILYIREPLRIEIDPEDFDNSLLKECTVLHKVIDNFVEIKEQKCVLDEVTMNQLFDEILSGFAIKYGYNGGAGCDFSISIFARPE